MFFQEPGSRNVPFIWLVYEQPGEVDLGLDNTGCNQDIVGDGSEAPGGRASV